MLDRFSRFFACLLLILIPLQCFAAANISICNSMMQAQMSQHQSLNKPCHMTSMNMTNMTKTHDNCKHKSACKTNCATLCASLNGITTLTQTMHAVPEFAGSQALVASNKTYTSYSPPNLQRPPIFVS